MACRVNAFRDEVVVVAVNGTVDLWQPMTPFILTTGVLDVRGTLVLAEKSGNFRIRIGIQTVATDLDVRDAPVSPSSGTGLGYLSAVGKTFVDFDPTVATNGNVNTKFGMRLGILYSSTDASISRGDVILRMSVRIG